MLRYIAKSSAKLASLFHGKRTVVKQAALIDATGLNFLRACISAIEERGLCEQNIYRLSANDLMVNTLLQKGLSPPGINKLKSVDWRIIPTSVLTCAIKRYFRELPEPVFTFRLYDGLLNATKNPHTNSRINQIKELIQKLPQLNVVILQTLIEHLERVASLDHINMMTPEKLGACFGPTLVRPEVPPTDPTGADIKLCNIVLEILIANKSLIFDPKPERSISPRPVSNMHTPKFVSQHITLSPSINVQDADSSMSESNRAVVLHSCKGYFPADLELTKNDIIENVRETFPGWVEGTFSGETVLFPIHLVKFID